MTGGVFPIAAEVRLSSGDGPGEAAGRLETADHVGASSSALLGAVLFVPLLGIVASVWLIAALVAIALVATAGSGDPGVSAPATLGNPMASERDRLSEQVHLLGDLLGRTIVEQEGQPLFDLVEDVRGLAKAHRAGDEAAGERLLRRVEALPLAESRGVVKAFATYFQLVNLAEEQERVRVLRRREREAHAAGSSAIETIGAAVGELRETGASAEEVQALLDRLLIMPVFTAHPTEAKRRTILTKLARIADVLRGLDLESPTPEEERSAHEVLREELVSLWRTEETRAYKPDVMDEVRNGLYFFESVLHDLAPEVAASLERAVAAHYPGAVVRPGFLRFGSWIGGDRDGNPFVTVAATEETLRAHHELALRLLRRGIERLHGHLSTSERLGADAELAESLRADAALFPEEAKRAEERYHRQPYRQKLLYVYRKLGTTLEASSRPWRADHRVRPGTYADAPGLLADLRLLQRSLAAHGAAAAGGRPPGDARCDRRRSSASTWRASTSGSTARGTRARSRRCSADTAWRRLMPRRARTSARAC